MFALPISMSRFKSIIFNQNDQKLSYFCKKMQNFRALGAQPRHPQSPHPSQNAGYAPAQWHNSNFAGTESVIGSQTLVTG